MMLNALVSIQIIPQTPAGADIIPYVDSAIQLIIDSGLAYRVSPLETTMEGELEQCLAVVRQMNEALLASGCPAIISQVKTYCPAPAGALYQLTEKYDA